MKKIILAFALIIIGMDFVYAQEETIIPIPKEELQNIIKNNPMPTDAEILHQLRQYNLNEQEASELYQKTKEQLQKTYETGNVEHLEELQKTPEFQQVQQQVIQNIQEYKNQIAE